MKTSAIIAAGGSGSRMKTEEGKLFLELKGVPILLLALSIFDSCDIIDEIIVPVPPDDIERVKQLVERAALKKVRHIIQGGATRQASVYNGLQVVSQDSDIIIIHDGARPFVSREMILDAVSQIRAHTAVIVGMPVKDTIKSVNDERLVSNTLDRELLWQVQTPQVFEAALIKEAYQRAEKLGIRATDDAGLVERLGEKVKMISGSYENIKITTQEDLILGEAILNSRHLR